MICMHVHPRLNWQLPKHILLTPIVAQKHCRVGGTIPSTSRTCTTAWRWWWKVSGNAASARRTLWHSQSRCQTAANKHCWRATFLRHTSSRYSVTREIRRRRIILPLMLPSSIWHTFHQHHAFAMLHGRHMIMQAPVIQTLCLRIT